MPKLELRFENRVLDEYAMALQPLVIGRGLDCDVVIDNLAISTHHARVFPELNHYVVEDQKSLNGTYVNGQRIERKILRDGDQIAIGKHTLVFYEYATAAATSATAAPKAPAPKLEGTFILDTKKRLEMLKEPTEAAVVAMRVPVAHLKVLKGKTDQVEYVLTSKLTLIGKSEMATIRLRGWFKPKTAGVITRKGDVFYVGPASRKRNVRVNGNPVRAAQLVNDGDVIEVSGVQFLFSLPK